MNFLVSNVVLLVYESFKVFKKLGSFQNDAGIDSSVFARFSTTNRIVPPVVNERVSVNARTRLHHKPSRSL